eukprot:1207535-Rhodomonas_salina.5
MLTCGPGPGHWHWHGTPRRWLEQKASEKGGDWEGGKVKTESGKGKGSSKQQTCDSLRLPSPESKSGSKSGSDSRKCDLSKKDEKARMMCF